MQKSLLRNQNFILFFALFCGLLFGGVAEHTRVLVLPILGLVMTLSSALRPAPTGSGRFFILALPMTIVD